MSGKPSPIRREKLLPAPRKAKPYAARATMARKCFGTRSRNGVETPKPVATNTAAAQPLISRQLATPRPAFRSKQRCLDPPMSRKPTFRHNSQHRELRFALNRDTASPRTETNAAAQALISQQALHHCSPPLRSKPRCCEFSTPRQAQSKRLDAPIRWQQCPFWSKWDELPAMLDALASPALTNRSHFGRLFPPNLALRCFAIPRLSHIALFPPSCRTGLSLFVRFPPSRAAPLSHFARFKPTSKTTSSTAAAKQRSCTSRCAEYRSRIAGIMRLIRSRLRYSQTSAKHFRAPKFPQPELQETVQSKQID